MIKTKFQVGDETLSALRVGSDKPTILYLHGAGQSNKERGLPIMEKLADAGLSTFCFDFSGHGESTGEMKNSSLKKRLVEAEAALTYLDNEKPTTIIGSSMAGHIVLELLKNHPDIKNIILFYPAIYSANAFAVPFTDEFSAIIREPKSWADNDVIGPLQKFTGNLLIIIGENDQVIPIEAIEMIYSNATSAASREIVTVPEAEHLLLPKLLQNKELFNEVITKIVGLVS